MKEDWDKLMQKYEGHASALVGDVDCTADESKELCETHGVQGCLGGSDWPPNRIANRCAFEFEFWCDSKYDYDIDSIIMEFSFFAN